MGIYGSRNTGNIGFHIHPGNGAAHYISRLSAREQSRSGTEIQIER